MQRSERRVIRALTVLAIVTASVPCWASPLTLPLPIAPIPPTPGTGLWSQWAPGPQGSFNELNTALTFLSSASSVRLDGVGPISFSNFIVALGDFPQHATMPFSPRGQPTADGQYIVGSMQGWWAARSAGTYSLAIGCDDGFRVQIAGIDVFDHAPAEAFRRSSAVLDVVAPGLYPIRIDYFNGVEEGAIELSIAAGDVGVVSPTAALPGSFALVPLEDLYPFDLVVAVDAGAASIDPWSDAGGAPSADGGATGDPSATLGGAPLSDGSGGERSWRGGGCQTVPSNGPGSAALTLIFGIAYGWRSRRRRAS